MVEHGRDYLVLLCYAVALINSQEEGVTYHAGRPAMVMTEDRSLMIAAES